jgi:hypothetical protein
VPRTGRPKKLPDAANWLSDFILKGNGIRLATEIKLVGKVSGYGWRTLKVAKAQLGIKSQRRGRHAWVWFNPFFLQPDSMVSAETNKKLEELQEKLSQPNLKPNLDKPLEPQIQEKRPTTDAIRRVARIHHGLAKPIDKTIQFIKERAKGYTQEEITELVHEEYRKLGTDGTAFSFKSTTGR